MSFRPTTDFDHAILVYVKLLCNSLGILDVTSPTRARAILDDKSEENKANRRSYTRSHRKVRRRITKLVNAECQRAIATSDVVQQKHLIKQLVTSNKIAAAHVDCYLVDVTCMLVDGNLKRATNLAPNYVRRWKEADLRRHVNKTYKLETSKFQLDSSLTRRECS